LVENRGYADGMFSSVLAGVAALPDAARAFFLLPGDCCAVLPETLTGLIKAFERLQTTVFPTFDSQRGHPPLIPYSLAAALLEYGGEGGTKGFLAQYPSAELPVSDGGILLDMDTPRDYADMLRSLNLAPDRPDGA
jgi:CTP:molybdopterin cytidylyltransferase MocA